MTEVQAQQLKLFGIHNIKKIFSTEKLLLRASSFLFQIKNSHCENFVSLTVAWIFGYF